MQSVLSASEPPETSKYFTVRLESPQVPRELEGEEAIEEEMIEIQELESENPFYISVPNPDPCGFACAVCVLCFHNCLCHRWDYYMKMVH